MAQDANNLTNLEEMPGAERNSETSRLVSPSHTPKPSYINLFSNICAVILVGIISYCSFSKSISLFTFHPILMTLGWMVFMTTAINSITPGDIATEWMPIRLRSARHWFIQLIAGIIILIGFLLIVSHKIDKNKPQFATLHSKFGLVSFIFMFVTMLGGLGALYGLKLKDYLPPLYTKLIHATAGLITFILGVITILIILFAEWWEYGEILRYTCLVLVIFIALFTILRPMLKIYFRIKERLENIS